MPTYFDLKHFPQRKRRMLALMLLVVSSLLALSSTAMAAAAGAAQCAAGGGGGLAGALPYEANLCTFIQSVTGPVAFTLSLLGIIGALAALLFGGDLSGFFRVFTVLILCISIIASAGNVYAWMQGGGAVIPTKKHLAPGISQTLDRAQGQIR